MKNHLRIFNLLLISLFCNYIYNKQVQLDYKTDKAIETFNKHFEENIYIIKNEVNNIYKTREIHRVTSYKTIENFNYFSDNNVGVFFYNINPIPKFYKFYKINNALHNLNNKFNNSLFSIIYSEINSSNSTSEIIYTSNFNKRQLSYFKENSLTKGFFKYRQNISKCNKFHLCDAYSHYSSKFKFFTIIIPEYRFDELSQTLDGVWYFNFNEQYFKENLYDIKETLSVNAAVVDSLNNIICSTSKNFTLHDTTDFYLGKTNYKIVIKNPNFFSLIEYPDFILFIFLILSLVYTLKKDQLTSQLDSLKVNEKIKNYLILRDPLTNLYNRYFLEVGLDFKNNKCAVALIDIDYFKKINDNFGHQKGDHTLKAVSGLLKLIAKGNAHCLRWGGEEFLIIFENISENEVKNKLYLLRNLIKNIDILPDNKIITASFGVCYKKITNKEDLYQAISEADKNLYIAKETGRDKIVF